MLSKNKVVKNASWIITGKIVQSLLGLVISMIIARYLGPSNYGIISYATSIVAFVIPFMNLGFSNVLVQELTNYPEDEGKIIGTSIFLSVLSSFVCIIGIATFTFFVDAGEKIINIVVCLSSLMLVFQAFELIQYWFQYKLLSKYQAIVTLIAYSIVSVYKIIILVSKSSIYWFALTYSIDYLLIAGLLLLIYKRLGGKHISFSSKIGKRMFSKSKHYIVSSLMVTVFAQTDRVMLKFMINETAVGYYNAAITCAGMTSFIFAAIIDSFRPSILIQKKLNNEKLYEKNISLLYFIIIYLALAQSLLMSVAAPLIINILYGKSFFESISALQIIVWYTTFSYMGSVRNIWVLGENKQKYLWILNMSGALLNIGLNYFLIPIWGINGAAVASLITQIFTNVLMNVVVWPLRHNNILILKGLNPKLFFNFFR